jgi:hypothetical protein
MAVAVPFCTRVTPLVETLMLGPVCTAELEAFDEFESDGVAEATKGVAAIAAPMPRVMASAPTRENVGWSCDSETRFIAGPFEVYSSSNLRARRHRS